MKHAVFVNAFVRSMDMMMKNGKNDFMVSTRNQKLSFLKSI